MLTSVALCEFLFLFFVSSATTIFVGAVFHSKYPRKRANAVVFGILLADGLQALLTVAHCSYWILFALGYVPYSRSARLFCSYSSFLLLTASSAFDWLSIGIIAKRIFIICRPLDDRFEFFTTTVIFAIVLLVTSFGAVGFFVIYVVDPSEVIRDSLPAGCFTVGCGAKHPPVSQVFLVHYPIASTVLVIVTGVVFLVILRRSKVKLPKYHQIANVISKYIFIFHTVFLLIPYSVDLFLAMFNLPNIATFVGPLNKLTHTADGIFCAFIFFVSTRKRTFHKHVVPKSNVIPRK
ncbi:hypothetical protein QR680_009767 [Steinernema hermaphroditum]|uniref:Uncharacterized protein n=1 Tax=Steinernema hermaphroditum TaxID=289476 RepID=A0AA39ILK3_9BILA|nr:hypothetical protein QR680_009767 [Steinernema hermaphroditum]